jgi:3-oxoisoapionate decarboxylase
VVNLHVKDFSIQRASHMMGFSIEGQPAGRGRLNVLWLLEALHGKGRNPNAILELWTPPDADLAATIAREASWARESVHYLRRWITE